MNVRLVSLTVFIVDRNYDIKETAYIVYSEPIFLKVTSRSSYALLWEVQKFLKKHDGHALERYRKNKTIIKICTNKGTHIFPRGFK